MRDSRLPKLYANLFGLLAGFFLALPAQAVVLYNLDSMVLDGSSGENTYSVSGTITPGATPSFANSSSYGYVVGYFESTTIGVGESMVISFAGTYTNRQNIDQSWRWGLFDSNDSKLTGNVSGQSSATFSGYRGYRADYQVATGGTNSASLIRERTSNSSNLFTTSGSAPSLTSTPSPLPQLGLTDDPFTGTFTIERISETTVQITTDVNGVLGTATDSTSAFTTFDTFSFWAQSNSSAVITFSELTVTLVPEASPALLALAGGLLITARRGLRRRGLS